MSYTLNKTGAQIDAILDRADTGGAIDDAIDLKAPLASPALTGTPTAPTASAGTDTTQIATTAFVHDVVDAGAEAAAKQFAPMIEASVGPSAIASFSDGANGVPIKSGTFQVEPKQDLNGQAYPWPAGGGKNKLPLTLASIKSLNTTGTWSDNVYTREGVTFTVQVDNGGNVERIDAKGTATAFVGLQICDSTSFGAQSVILSGCPTGGSSTTYDIAVFDDSVSPVVNKGNNYGGNGVEFTAESGHTYYVRIAIRNGYAISGTISFYPMIRLSAEADATFAPYSNICPITGWTGATITKRGANWYDKSTVTASGRNKRISTANGGTYSSTGSTATAYVPIIGGQTYTLTTGRTAYTAWYDKDKTFIAGSNWGNGSSKTFPENAAFFKFDYATDNEDSVMLNLGSTALPFAPYTSTTATLDWSTYGTVYGGSIEAVTGAGKVEWTSIDLGERDWTYDSDNGYFYAPLAQLKDAPIRTLKLYCSQYQCIDDGRSYADSPDKSIFNRATPNVGIIIKDSAYTDAAAFKTAMSGVQLVFPRAAAQDFSTDGIQVSTLKGDNNVWADCGQTTLNYRADTKLYIDGQIAALQALVLENNG